MVNMLVVKENLNHELHNQHQRPYIHLYGFQEGFDGTANFVGVVWVQIISMQILPTDVLPILTTIILVLPTGMLPILVSM